jgi:hypothetical protein
MKLLSIIIAALVLAFGAIASSAADVDRISAATGVPVATLQTEKASTGLGWGSLEKAHLFANATGQSFDNIVATHQSGQGWGKIARDNGIHLGRLVSDANRSSEATMQAQNTGTIHGKSGTHVAKSHSVKTSRTRGFSGSHGMHSTGHGSEHHGMGSRHHAGGHGR